MFYNSYKIYKFYKIYSIYKIYNTQRRLTKKAVRSGSIRSNGFYTL